MADEDPLQDRASLRRAGAFFSRRPEFLGYWLDLYRESEDIEVPALARILGCTMDTVAHLALCLRPRPEQLWEDTAELAERYGIDQDRLCDLLHDAETYQAVRTAGPATPASPTSVLQGAPAFAAARDREDLVVSSNAEAPSAEEVDPDGG
ncbi:MAG TPA: hypothetical protein VK689_02455 [Armatimonadota bacterium]|nr:hypothetical protein [Armatimonadota bacterium]